MIKKLLYLVLLANLIVIGCSSLKDNKQTKEDLAINDRMQKQEVTSEQEKTNSNVVRLSEVSSLDIESIENFQLPETAIEITQLNIIDSLYYMNGNLYSGTAYSSFKNGQIKEFKSIKDGRLSGPAYNWYEDGSYAMEANFLNGYLAGRFVAWSEVGDLIYDMYFDKGQFKSDLQYERDTDREDQGEEAGEGDADSDENSGE